jgi:hypothetical protein
MSGSQTGCKKGVAAGSEKKLHTCAIDLEDGYSEGMKVTVKHWTPVERNSWNAVVMPEIAKNKRLQLSQGPEVQAARCAHPWAPLTKSRPASGHPDTAGFLLPSLFRALANGEGSFEGMGCFLTST